MRSATQIISVLILIISFNFCRQQETQQAEYYAADSLLKLTLELQTRIGSPEIQRMHDFQEEIESDLAVLSPVVESDSSVLRYRELYNGLGVCMKACNQYHEEAFMLESSLREIMEQVQSPTKDLKEIHDQLLFENGNYKDLKQRIDSSMRMAISRAEIFYSLKPEIKRIKEELTSSPDPKP